VLALTEMWHEDSGAACIPRLHASGWQVLERARPIPTGANTDDLSFVNHGGVAIVAPTGVKMEKMKPVFEPLSFEHLLVRLSVQQSSCVFAVIYRPGAARPTPLFFDELTSGDLNVRFDRPDDPACQQVNDLLLAFDLHQHVDVPTHDRGGTLDVVVTRNDFLPDSITVSEVGFSAHSMVRWTMNLPALTAPAYITRERRSWKQFDVDKFRADLQQSAMVDTSVITAAADTHDCAATHSSLVALYDKTLTDLLDRHAPVTTKTTRRRPRTDLWFDEDYRKAKRMARRLERRYKRHRSEYSRSVWLQPLRRVHNVADEKRTDFWKRMISEQTNVRQAWKVIDRVLCRDS